MHTINCEQCAARLLSYIIQAKCSTHSQKNDMWL